MEDDTDQKRIVKEILSKGKWVMDNWSVSDEQMRAKFRTAFHCEPKHVLRENWWVYAGPTPGSVTEEDGSGQGQV